MNNNRIVAKVTGYALLLMAVFAGFSFGFAFPKIYRPDQPDMAQSGLTENLQLYQFMLLGILAVILLDLLVSWTLYLFFKKDNKEMALGELGLAIWLIIKGGKQEHVHVVRHAN